MQNIGDKTTNENVQNRNKHVKFVIISLLNPGCYGWSQTIIFVYV